MKTCNYQPDDLLYAPCTREIGHDGPCAHPFASDVGLKPAKTFIPTYGMRVFVSYDEPLDPDAVRLGNHSCYTGKVLGGVMGGS